MTPKPSRPGICTSRKTRSGLCSRIRLTPSTPVLALGHDIHVADVFQQEGKFVAGKLFIVHDDCGQRHSNS